jgi:CubicO group peptidase (beta-lactamase class C family)
LQFFLFVFLIFLCAPLFAQNESADAQRIRTLLRDSVKKEKRWPGIAVGVVQPDGIYIFCEGKVRAGSTNEVDGDTIFQIASVTKTFTTLLLELMVDRKEVSLDDPLARLLPAEVKMPKRGTNEITLLDVATHTSGLPRMPMKTPTQTMTPPFTMAEVYKFLGEYELRRDIGSLYQYSNLGVGLLGHALTLKARTNYEALVVREVCDPLQMNDTRVELTPRMKEHAATPHDVSGRPLPRWFAPSFPAAGGLCSSVNDMVKYVSAQLGLTPSPLFEAMRKTQIPRRKGVRNVQVGLGWHVLKVANGDLIFHNGAEPGFHSYVGFNKQKKCGIVVLVNSANETGQLPFQILKQLPMEKYEPAGK